jgi:hypothetical protein
MLCILFSGLANMYVHGLVGRVSDLYPSQADTTPSMMCLDKVYSSFTGSCVLAGHHHKWKQLLDGDTHTCALWKLYCIAILAAGTERVGSGLHVESNLTASPSMSPPWQAKCSCCQYATNACRIPLGKQDIDMVVSSAKCTQSEPRHVFMGSPDTYISRGVRAVPKS